MMLKAHRNLVVLEADPDLLQELELRHALDEFDLVAVSSRVRLIRPEQVEALTDKLLDLGYLPGIIAE